MRRTICLLFFLIQLASAVQLQNAGDLPLQHSSLQDCIRYALEHQPALHQSLLDEDIVERSVQSKLADWYPQLNFSYTIEHYPQIPVSIVQGFPAEVSTQNTSSGQFLLTQNIFNKDVLLASSSAADVRSRMRQQTINNKIDVVVNVSKAYYSALETQEQIALLDEDILRLQQSLKDAYEQYRGGIVDNIDYKRATILLNNALSEKKQNEELLNARYAFLKEQMGYPMETELTLEYDSTQMARETSLDTNWVLHYENRIEYQLLQTQKRIQEANVTYAAWSFLPSLNAFASYNLNYQQDELSRLYNQNYPNSLVGIQLSFPIFQGGKRLQGPPTGET